MLPLFILKIKRQQNCSFTITEDYIYSKESNLSWDTAVQTPKNTFCCHLGMPIILVKNPLFCHFAPAPKFELIPGFKVTNGSFWRFSKSKSFFKICKYLQSLHK